MATGDPSLPGPRRVRLLLEYEGTDYAGWQLQANAPTVQQVVEEAVAATVGHAARVHGAGRTDAGVHALGQVAHFETSSSLPPDTLKRALNARLPGDVAVIEAREAAPDFHARFSARGKTYCYAILNQQGRSALDRRLHWHVRFQLDDTRMREAGAALLGKHDFRAFSTLEGGRNPVRELKRLELAREGPLLFFLLEADSFLWKMVRGIVGSLVDVGRGRRPAGWPAEVLAGKDRRSAGPTAPAQGLFLAAVDYGEGAVGAGAAEPPVWHRFFLAGNR